jgi:hypothetical protein
MAQGIKIPGGITQVPPSVWATGGISGNGTQSDPLNLGGSSAELPTADNESFVPGAPVLISTFSGLHLALAGAAGSFSGQSILGLATGTADEDGSEIGWQFLGNFEQPAAAWEAVTGESVGLTAGSRYYVDSVTAGQLTKIKPTAGGTYVILVGIAVSATELQLQIGQPVLN